MNRISRFVPLALLSLLLLLVAACTPLPAATPAAGEDAEAETQVVATEAPVTVTPAPDAGVTEATATEPAATEPTAAPAGGDLMSACPAASGDMQRLVNFEHGYCLTYPAEYKVEKPNESETLLVIGGLLDAMHARAHIRVEPAAGRTAESAADQIEKDFEGFTPERSGAMVAGQPAVVLDKLPGQEINRRVLFVYGDQLYSFYFSPADPVVEAFADMEALYQDILGSFTLFSQGAELPTERRMMDCLSTTAGTQALVNKNLGFCLLYPADYQAEETSEGEVVLYAGSLMDVSRPKAFIQVVDAEGRTAQQVVEAVIKQFGEGVERTFGVTIGYEVAEQLEKVPGQDLSRQVIAVRGDRVYTLVFVPADEAQGEVYQEVEGLYELVVRSFRFLN